MLTAVAIPGLPEIEPGAELAALLVDGLGRIPEQLADGDIVVIAHKAISKAEGRIVSLADITPGLRALELAREQDKDPRHVQVVLDEAASVIRAAHGVIVCETRHGFICANAGVDGSNLELATEVCMLPIDSDVSADGIRAAVRERTGAEVAVIISDTFGRPWRTGQTNVAIGLAGMHAIHDYRGQIDSAGMVLVVTEIAVADELAAAAELAMGKLDRVPAAVVRGYEFEPAEGRATELVRPAEFDMFR